LLNFLYLGQQSIYHIFLLEILLTQPFIKKTAVYILHLSGALVVSQVV
jgi:hypothetical protein